MFIHQPTNERFRLCSKWLLPDWTINFCNADRDDFGFVTDRDLVTTTDRDNEPLKFRLSRSRQA
jgi:hypothetical protein